MKNSVKIDFSRVAKNLLEGSRYITVYMDGKNIGEIYREKNMMEWAIDHSLEEILGENAASGHDDLRKIKAEVKSLLKETQEGAEVKSEIDVEIERVKEHANIKSIIHEGMSKVFENSPVVLKNGYDLFVSGHYDGEVIFSTRPGSAVKFDVKDKFTGDKENLKTAMDRVRESSKIGAAAYMRNPYGHEVKGIIFNPHAEDPFKVQLFKGNSPRVLQNSDHTS